MSMMTLDAKGMAQFVVRLGLMSDQDAREVVYELDNNAATAEDFVRYCERKTLLTPWQSSKLRKGDTDGYILGGYKLLYKIASGSFGRVFRGVDPAGQVVALKVLRRRWTDDPRWVDHFRREGQIGLSMQHPNIVGILAVNKDDRSGQHYIAMEFVEGGNLRDIMRARKKLPADEALRIMEECAAGLTYAFSRGLSHRDIKLTNILISTQTKAAKLVDFGLGEIAKGSALFFERVQDRDDEEAMDRTVDYAGLEKATGVPQGDVRSDIYFLGHVLYEMITGDPLMPPTKDRNARMQRRRFEDVETQLYKVGADRGLPPVVLKLIGRTVALDPKERFQTPQQYLEAIQACRAELGGQSGASIRRAPGPLTIYVVEQHEKLQDVFRHKFKKMGFKVLISADAGTALRRYQVSPYHALVIDCGTIGRDGLEAFERVQKQAVHSQLDLAAVLILNEDQAAWEGQIKILDNGVVLVRPVTMTQLHDAVVQLLTVEEREAAAV
jgi:eukaryotic-like serine/threonine-protein kinase